MLLHDQVELSKLADCLVICLSIVSISIRAYTSTCNDIMNIDVSHDESDDIVTSLPSPMCEFVVGHRCDVSAFVTMPLAWYFAVLQLNGIVICSGK